VNLGSVGKLKSVSKRSTWSLLAYTVGKHSQEYKEWIEKAPKSGNLGLLETHSGSNAAYSGVVGGKF
jgi:hypothetical protein